MSLCQTLGDAAIEYILKHSSLRLVVTAGSKLPALLKALPKCAGVASCGVVYWGEAAEENVEVREGHW